MKDTDTKGHKLYASVDIDTKCLEQAINRERKKSRLDRCQKLERWKEKWVQVSFWDDDNVLKLDNGDGLHNVVDILNATELYTL